MDKLRRRCKCGCGKITSPGRGWLQGHCNRGRKDSQSGHYKHGLTNHKLYWVWIGMKQRCYYKKHQQYQDWGGRGINIYIRWRLNFKSFYNWAITHGYKEGLQIDRKDNDGNYHPDNCRFVTSKVNNNNRRTKGIQKNNITGVKGVSFDKRVNKYQVNPWIDGKQRYFGRFNTLEEAVEAVNYYTGNGCLG